MNTKTILRYTAVLLALGLTMTACADEDYPQYDFPGADTEDMDDSYGEEGGEDDGAETDGADESGGDDEPGDDEDTGDGPDDPDTGDDPDAPEPACGDGVLDAELGEQCDDGNADDLDGCMSNCGVGPTDISIDYLKESDLGPWHPNGASNFAEACPEGQVIIGVDGRDGAHIDQVKPRCGIIKIEDPADGLPTLSIEPAEFLSPQGGNGGGAFSLQCGDDEAVVGLSVRDVGGAVERLQLRCAKLELAGDGLEEPVTFALGPMVATGEVGNSHGFSNGADCAPGEVAVRHHGQQTSGVCIDAYGLTCRPIELLWD